MQISILSLLILICGLAANPVTKNYSPLGNYGTYQSNLNNTTSRSVASLPSQKQNDCNDKFCIGHTDYPKNYIQALDFEKFEYFFGSEIDDQFSTRFDADETGLCESRRRVIYPTRGVTAGGTWLTIINNEDGKLVQGVLVEECTKEYRPCDYSQNFPLSVETQCKQSYAYRGMVAIGVNGQPIKENFRFPSCCKCFVTVGHRSNQNRFGAEYILPY